ncbi:MAG: efflux RND transporter periplasmic adaptor subunit [Desulfamplus sp.]|nr:efflux RND transporter periplasmic adaptor subunit [Desulfamplus sp.]
MNRTIFFITKNLRTRPYLKIIPYLLAFFIQIFLFLPVCPQLLQASPGKGEAIGDYRPEETVQASRETIVQTYTAVGTVKPRSETRIEAQIQARIEKVHFQAGDRVKKGDILITLDDRQALSRLDGAKASLGTAVAARQQAIQAVAGAQAAHSEARLNYDRIKSYFESNAATKQELEMAESTYTQASASLTRAKDALKGAESGIRQATEFVEETRIGLGFSKIPAPSSGEVIRRMVEPGDMAMPGKPLIFLRTESGFRIEAHVREGLIHKVVPGMELSAEITSINATCPAHVEEIIPYADPDTRTFLVKALLPDLEGLYPGMYGKLLIPDTSRDVVLLPMGAVIHMGQLEMVMVNTDKGWQLRYIKTGKQSGDMVEVLSGLSGGETVGTGYRE